MTRTLTAMVGMVSIVVLAGAAQSQAPPESKGSMKADQVITVNICFASAFAKW